MASLIFLISAGDGPCTGCCFDGRPVAPIPPGIKTFPGACALTADKDSKRARPSSPENNSAAATRS